MRLYNQCHLGTKRAIEKYIDEVIKCIQTIYVANPNHMSIESKLEFFAETRHAYGRTALMLSGGATFGKFHWGVLRALYEQDLFPRIICGSSAGAVIAAGIAAENFHEMEKVSFKKFNSRDVSYLFFSFSTHITYSSSPSWAV